MAFPFCFLFNNFYRYFGSMPEPEQLRTYPPPNPTTVNWQQLRVNVELGEGEVRTNWSAISKKIYLLLTKT